MYIQKVKLQNFRSFGDEGIALLFQGSGSYAFYGIPVLADNTNQVGERFLIYMNRIDKVDTAVDDSDLIAGCNIQSTHLLYNSVAL